MRMTLLGFCIHEHVSTVLQTGLLSVLLEKSNAVLAYRPRPDSELIRLVAPSSVVPEGTPDPASMTLNRWKQLGSCDDVVKHHVDLRISNR